MAQITNEGITTRDLAGYRTLLEERYRDAFGADVALDAETPFGQIIGIEALALAEYDEQFAAMVNGVAVGSAQGRQQDDLGSLLNIARGGATHSTVTITIAGEAGTAIPSGSRARTNAGDEWETTGDATIPNTGSTTVAAQAVEEGEVEAAAGTITTIVTLIAGWETVTNAAAAVPGVARTRDSLYRTQYRARTGRLAAAPLDALRAGLSEAGVTRQRIEENYTSAAVTRQTLTIAAHSVMCIVEGGTDAAIAAAILERKGLGTGMSGATTAGGASFQRISEVPIAVEVETTANSRFPAAGLANMRANLVAYGLGTWESGAGDFDTEGFQIGELIDSNRLLSPINAVPGHRVTSLEVTLSNGNALPATIALNGLYTLDIGDVTVTIN